MDEGIVIQSGQPTLPFPPETNEAAAEVPPADVATVVPTDQIVIEEPALIEGSCPKTIGADFELANGLDQGSPGYAAGLLLAEISGYPRRQTWNGTAIEYARRFLPGNGGSAYIDSDHLEINTPEHASAVDHVGQIHAGLLIARRAQVAAQAKIGTGNKLHCMASVTDGQASWGHHLNVSVTRKAWNGIVHERPYLGSFLATHLVTSIIYTGQGCVGESNGRAPCDFQLAQRPDWFERFADTQTMFNRPVVNTRDESHARDGLARMHIIYFDMSLSPTAVYLKAGTTQLVLAMIEAGWVDPALLLDDPVGVASEISRDLTFKQSLHMAARGQLWTAVDVQQGLADLAGEFVRDCPAAANVPGAADIVATWREVLDLIRRGEVAALARRCDWALKMIVLGRQRSRAGKPWKSPDIKALDLKYGSIDPDDSIFQKMVAAGMVDGMPTTLAVLRYADEPPDDTRAWFRTEVMRRFGDDLSNVDWSALTLRNVQAADGSTRWCVYLNTPNPASHRRDQVSDAIARVADANELAQVFGENSRAFQEYSGWDSGWSNWVSDNETPRRRKRQRYP